MASPVFVILWSDSLGFRGWVGGHCVCVYIWQAAVLSEGIRQVENASGIHKELYSANLSSSLSVENQDVNMHGALCWKIKRWQPYSWSFRGTGDSRTVWRWHAWTTVGLQFSLAPKNLPGRNQSHRFIRLASSDFMGSCLGKKPKFDISLRGMDEVNPKSDITLGIRFPTCSFLSQIKMDE